MKWMMAVAACLVVGMISIFGSAALAAPGYSDWSDPVNLGPIVNSAAFDTGPAISKDGLSLFFGSQRPGGLGNFDLYVSQRATTDDAWGPPTWLGPTVNSPVVDNIPSLSRDEHWMFFNSPRPGGYGLNDVWATYREHVHDDFGWEAPVNLGPGVNSAFSDQGGFLFENEDLGVPLLYFGSDRPGGLGGLDIYVSVQAPDGTFGPAALVPELSSSAGDQRPVVRFDGLELFLSSTRAGGFGGLDIWVSTRESTSDPWGAPENAGASLNGPYDDWQAYIGSDRVTLYFVSNRPEGSGSLDLYVTSRTRTE